MQTDASIRQRNNMICFDLDTHIYRPLKQVFSFVATPENDFQWQYGTLEAAPISTGEIGIGSQFRAIGHFMGRRIKTTYEVTKFETNTRYGFRSLSGPLDSYTLYSFEPTDDGTKVSLYTETTPRELAESIDALAVKKFKKQHKENLATLKSTLETHRISTI